MEQSDVSCVFCGGQFWRWQTVAGDRVGVCEVCAGAVTSAVLDGVLQPALACLHLTAMEVERGLSPQLSRQRRVLRRLQANFAASAFRMVCACATCREVQARADEGRERVFQMGNLEVFTDFSDGEMGALAPDLVEMLSDLEGFDRQNPVLQVLRSFPDRSRVPGPDGRRLAPKDAAESWKEHYRDQTSVPEDVESRMQALAAAVEPPGPFVAFGAVAASLAEKRAVQDETTWRHWNMVQKYGPGLRDGAYWLARDGRVIPLAPADAQWPMTAADRRALIEDRKRARAWREDGGHVV